MTTMMMVKAAGNDYDGEGDGDGENGAGRVELDPVTLVSGVQRQSPDLLAQGRNEATFA